ncbi:MAG: hypothetical protein ACTSQF_11860, partial [Candidatus Heimdallarchaeaceae archaeon]
HNMGIFISYNNREGGSAKIDFFNGFMEYYFPYHNDNIEPMENYKDGLNDFSGVYLGSRRHYSFAPGIPMRYWIQIYGLRFTSTGENLLLVGTPLEFIQIAPSTFVESTGEYDFTVVFFRDEKGRVTHFHSDLVGPTSTYEKLNYLEGNLDTFNGIIIAFAVIYIIALAYWGTKGLNNFLTKSEDIRSLDTILKWWFLGVPATFIPYALYINARFDSIIFLEKEVPSIFGSTYILLIFTLIFTAGQVIFSIASWISFKPGSIKFSKEEQSDVKTETEELEEQTLEEPIEESKLSKIIVRVKSIFNTLQPLLKRLLYSLLSILSIVLVSLLISWNLLDIF